MKEDILSNLNFCLTGVQSDDSAQAAESLNLLADGVNANKKVLPDKLV